MCNYDKVRVGELKGVPIVVGDSNTVTKNEILLKSTNDKISLYIRDSNQELKKITEGDYTSDRIKAYLETNFNISEDSDFARVDSIIELNFIIDNTDGNINNIKVDVSISGIDQDLIEDVEVNVGHPVVFKFVDIRDIWNSSSKWARLISRLVVSNTAKIENTPTDFILTSNVLGNRNISPVEGSYTWEWETYYQVSNDTPGGSNDKSYILTGALEDTSSVAVHSYFYHRDSFDIEYITRCGFLNLLYGNKTIAMIGFMTSSDAFSEADKIKSRLEGYIR